MRRKSQALPRLLSPRERRSTSMYIAALWVVESDTPSRGLGHPEQRARLSDTGPCLTGISGNQENTHFHQHKEGSPQAIGSQMEFSRLLT